MRLLETFEMEYCSTSPTVLPSGFIVDRNDIENYDNIESEKFPYRELVGALLFLSNTTRPDISFSVSLLSRYMKNPTKRLWNAAKHVLRYLKGTSSHEITYTKSPNDQMLHGFCDASFASDVTDRRSTSCLLYTSPSPRDQRGSRMPSSA